MYQALYRKWRPRTFDDVVGQSHITETLKRQVQEGRLSHAYLFTGTRGTGKTSCAKILARAVNCERPVDGNPCNECPACRGIEDGSVMEVLELDAASNNGVDQVRALRDEAVYSPAAVRKRVYIVDEVHMLSTAAFNALLKILEEPPEHLMFILATTELHKVPATIKSRCQQFAFKRITAGDIAGRLRYVAGEEGIPLAEEGANLLSRLADGGMRDALSLLDQCAGGGAEELGESAILAALGLAGNVETATLLKEIAARNAGAALESLDRLYAAGKDVGSLLGELASLVRDLLIRKTAPRGGAGLLTGGYDEQTLRGLSEMLNTSRLAQLLGQLQRTGADLGRSANRRVDAELCLIRLCDEALDESAAGLNARMARLEELAKLGNIAAVPPKKGTKEEPAVEEAVPQKELEAERPKAEQKPKAEPEPKAERSAPEPPKTEPVQLLPPPEEDAPPWDMEPPPPKEEAAAFSSQPKPEAERPSRPAPPPVPPSAPVHSSASQGGFWGELIGGLRGRIPMGEYSFLSNPAMVRGTADGPLLTLWAQSDFVKSMISKPGILAIIDKAAQTLPGAPYRVAVSVGMPPAAAKEAPPAAVSMEAAPETVPAEGEEYDKLDELLAFGEQFNDIITEE